MVPVGHHVAARPVRQQRIEEQVARLAGVMQPGLDVVGDVGAVVEDAQPRRVVADEQAARGAFADERRETQHAQIAAGVILETQLRDGGVVRRVAEHAPVEDDAVIRAGPTVARGAGEVRVAIAAGRCRPASRRCNRGSTATASPVPSSTSASAQPPRRMSRPPRSPRSTRPSASGCRSSRDGAALGDTTDSSPQPANASTASTSTTGASTTGASTMGASCASRGTPVRRNEKGHFIASESYPSVAPSGKPRTIRRARVPLHRPPV